MLRPSPISNISVTQPDNRSQKQQEVTFVFFDSRTGLALSYDNQLLLKIGKKIKFPCLKEVLIKIYAAEILD